MKKLLILLLLIGPMLSLGQSQPKSYHVWASEILQTDKNLVWEGDTLKKDSLTYAEISGDSIRFKKIRGSFTPWIKKSSGGDTFGYWNFKSGNTITPVHSKDTLELQGVNPDSVLYKERTQVVTGEKSFTRIIKGKGLTAEEITLVHDTTAYLATITSTGVNGMGMHISAPYVGLESWGTNSLNGYGIAAMSPNIPLVCANTQTASTGHRTVLALRGNSAYTTAENDFALDMNWYLPVLGWENPDLSEKLTGKMVTAWSDVTQDSEKARFEWWLMHNGILSKTMDLSSAGRLSVSSYGFSSTVTPQDPSGGDIYYDSDGTLKYYNGVEQSWKTMTGEPNLARTYSITLPSASTVGDRCSNAVEGTDYPVGWSIGAWSGNVRDLQLTHNLNRRIVSVTVYSTSAQGDRLLISSAAYTGVLAPDRNTLRIEGLATVLTPIVINLVFN